MDQALPHFLEVLYRRRWPATAAFLSVMGGILLYLIFAPRLYNAKVRLLLDERPAASISPLGRDIASQPGSADKSLATQEELAKSSKVISESLKAYKRKWGDTDPPLLVGDIKRNLEVITVPGTQIIELSYESENAEASANLLNLIANNFVNENVEGIRAEAQATRKFLDVQVPKKKKQLAKAEANISNFKQTHNVVSLGELDLRRLAESIAKAEDQVQSLSVQLQQLESRSDSLRSITDARGLSETYSSIRSGQDKELTKLRTQLADFDAQIAAKRKSLSEDHPEILTLLEERQAIQSLYSDKLTSLSNDERARNSENVASDTVSQNLSERYILGEIERQEVIEKLTATKTHLSELNARRQQFPVLEKIFAKLIRQQQATAESLKLLQVKLEEAKIAEAQLLSNLKIIEPAKIPGNPSSPQFLVVLILGTVVGLLQAVGIILLLEGLDRTIHDSKDIEKIIDFPVIGVVPALSNKFLGQNISASSLLANSGLVESYRSLLRTIEFHREENCLRMVIASAVPGEGKSLVASQLAAIAASYSRKTLLIDADLHHPSQHNIFNLSLKPGLQDCLLEEETLVDAIQKTTIDNLSVITVGKFYDNPSKFFESGAVSSFISEISHAYELVIVDTSSVTTSMDATTLKDISDSFVMVTRANVTPTAALQNTVSKLVGNGIQILGIVLNGCKSQVT